MNTVQPLRCSERGGSPMGRRGTRQSSGRVTVRRNATFRRIPVVAMALLVLLALLPATRALAQSDSVQRAAQAPNLAVVTHLAAARNRAMVGGTGQVLAISRLMGGRPRARPHAHRRLRTHRLARRPVQPRQRLPTPRPDGYRHTDQHGDQYSHANDHQHPDLYSAEHHRH